jgi:hypothetical protein
MPTYEVNIPGQGTFKVDSPTPLTDSQAYQFATGYAAPAPAPQAETGILAGLKKGVLSPFSSVRTGIESLLPEENAPENAALKGIQRQEELAKKYESSANLEKVKKAYEEKGLLSAAGEVISQVPGALAEQVPQLGAMWTGAVAGRKVGGTYGAVIGAAAPLIAQFYGTNIERQAQEQVKSGDPVKIDRGNAALASVGQTALDMVEARLLFGNKFISKTLGIEAKNLASMPTALVEKQAQEKLLPLVLKGTARGAATEIPTEVAQQIIERAQAGLPLTSPDAIAEYGDTMYNVALLGPLGVAGRLSERGAARGELAGREAADAAIARDQQLQATQAAQAAQAAQTVPPAAAPTMAPVTQAPVPTTQQNLFTQQEIPTQLAPDEIAVGKTTIPAPQVEERQLSELQRNIDALTQQGTPESLAEAEQLKAQLPEAPEARAFALGEEMMQLERKRKALETIRESTKKLDDKNVLTQQIKQIDARQQEVLQEGKALEKEGVSFEAPPEQMSLNLENVVTEDDFKTMGIGKGNKKLREAILGRSLNDPKERAFVVNALETYAQGNINEGLATRVGNFADEIKKGAPSGTVSEVGARAGKPSVPVLGGEFQPAGGVTAPAATGLAGAEPVVGGPAVGEGAAGEVGKAALTGELKGKSTIDLADRITQKDLKGALQDIATSKQYTPLDNLVARRLLQSKTLPKVEIVSPEVTKGYPAQYDPNTDTVQITPGNIDSHTVLHETVHGFLHAMIRTSEAREARGLGGNPNLKSLKDVYNHVKEKRPDLAEKYGMKDLSEFASEVMSNPDFQNDLRNTPYKRTNIFSEFARAVLRALGISPDAFNNADVDSLVAALTATERALSTGRKTQEDIQGGVRQQIEPEIARKEAGAFKNWFGDSKVVNEDGSPMRVYHGTTQDISQFKMSKEGALGAGIYMTPNTEFANLYAKETNGNVLPVYARIVNPLVIKSERGGADPAVDLLVALGVTREKAEAIVEKAYEDKGGITKEVVSRAQKQGYDGIFQYKNGELSEVVAFSPYQIKSAIGNQGTYSFATPDIARLERTPQGAQAEQDMAAFGGRPEQKPKGFVEKNRDSFQKIANDWRAAAQRNDSKVAATFGKFQNIASFDQAFNNRLYNHFMGLKNQGILTLEEAKQALLRVSTSQALHRTNLANQIIDRGNYTYDVDSNRWYAVDDDINMGKFEEIINSVADRLGVEPTRARQIVGAAYEANRLSSLYNTLRIAEKELAIAEKDLTGIKDAKQRATKKALISGLEEKVREFTEKVQHKTPEQVAAGMRLYNSIPEIKEGTDVWNTMRERVVKMMVDTGVKTQEQAEAWLDEAAYVPFFRDIEEEKAAGPNVMARGLRESMPDYQMKGSMKEVHDPIDNMYKWMQWSIARSVSNQQLNVMLDQYKAALPDEVKEGKGPESNTFVVYRNGIPRFFNVADPAIAQAFVGLEPIIFPGISWLTGSSNFLRHAVTRNPLFSAGQLFMDSYTAMFTSGLKNPFGLLKEIAKEVSATAQGKSATRTALMKAGILETHDYAALTEADAIGQRLGLEKPGAWAKLASRLDHLAAASDNVIRQGIYNQAIKEGLSHNEAMEKAAEIVNFRRVSGDPRIQFLSRIVPFFNAYLQVSSVAVKTLTGRGISPQERDAAAKVLMATTAKIAMISMLYSMAVGDDEDYKKKNRITRDRMWMIPGTGGLGIPVRSDVFSLPKVIGEYSYHMIADKGYTDSKMVKEALSRAVMGSLSVPSEGIPQFVRPTLGVMTNYDFFQKREIVNATMRKLDVSEQYTKNTSEMAKAFSSILGKMGIEASPLNIDYLVKGYLGTAGTLTAMATNDVIAMASGRTRPSMSMQDFLASIPNASAFVSKEENTAVLSDYYEAARDINKVVATASHLKNNPQAMRAYIDEHKKEYQLKGMTQAINNQLVMLKRRETQIRESNKSSEQKQEELKQIDARRNNLTAQVQRLRQKLYE